MSKAILMVAMLAVVGLAGCNQEATDPVQPSLELVDERQRIDASLVTAHVYGSFVIDVPGGLVPILSGPANFPGNPPGGPGTCVNGRWYNSKGKETAGSLEHPHPHCVTTGTAMTIVLEPISAQVGKSDGKACPAGVICDFLEFSNPKATDLDIRQVAKKGEGVVGTGIVVGYAIDAATLGTTNARVGTITFDLAQYTSITNPFGTCDLGDDLGEVECLPQVIKATYEPLAVGGVGSTAALLGFLWWSPAKSPYNY